MPSDVSVVGFGVPFLIGLVFMIAGGAIMWPGIKAHRMGKRVRETPVRPIASSPGNAPAMIQGRVYPSEEGLLPMPILGGYVAWYTIRVLSKSEVGINRRAGRNRAWQQIYEETYHRTFWVDDGSGQHALVQPRGAMVLVNKQTVARCYWGEAPSYAFQSFLAHRGLRSTNLLGLNKTLRCEAEYIAPGDVVRVLGPSRRASPGGHGAYRVGPASPLMVSLDEHSRDPFCITTKGNAALSNIGWETLFGALFFVVGVVALVFGTFVLGVLLYLRFR